MMLPFKWRIQRWTILGCCFRCPAMGRWLIHWVKIDELHLSAVIWFEVEQVVLMADGIARWKSSKTAFTHIIGKVPACFARVQQGALVRDQFNCYATFKYKKSNTITKNDRMKMAKFMKLVREVFFKFLICFVFNPNKQFLLRVHPPTIRQSNFTSAFFENQISTNLRISASYI